MQNDKAVTTQDQTHLPAAVGRQALALAGRTLGVSQRWVSYGGSALVRMIETTPPLPEPQVNLERLNELGSCMRAFEAFRFSLSSLLYTTDFTRRGWLFQLRFLLGSAIWVLLPIALFGGLFWGGIWLFGVLSGLFAKVVIVLLWVLLIVALITLLRALFKLIPKLLKML